jgi:hypothetical protein
MRVERQTAMKKCLGIVTLVSGGLFVVLAVAVLLWADGLRRWYSGIFLAVVGTVMMVNALRPRPSNRD